MFSRIKTFINRGKELFYNIWEYCKLKINPAKKILKVPARVVATILAFVVFIILMIILFFAASIDLLSTKGETNEPIQVN